MRTLALITFLIGTSCQAEISCQSRDIALNHFSNHLESSVSVLSDGKDGIVDVEYKNGDVCHLEIPLSDNAIDVDTTDSQIFASGNLPDGFITLSPQNGGFEVYGTASYENSVGAISVGEFTAHITKESAESLTKKPIRVFDNDDKDSGCFLDLEIIGIGMFVLDSESLGGNCGGANVSFTGIYFRR